MVVITPPSDTYSGLENFRLIVAAAPTLAVPMNRTPPSPLTSNPMLTSEIKAKILGLNAARIYGVDPDAKRCEIADDAFAKTRRDYKEGLATSPAPLRPTQVYKGPRSRRDFLRLWQKNPNYPA